MRARIACAASLAILSFAHATIHPANPSQNISWPYHSFKTVDFTPPVVNTTHQTDSSEEYLFFAPDGATEYQLAPLIVDKHGNLIWNGPKEHAFSFGTQQYHGESVLVWWNGTVFPEPVGRGNGVVYMFDNKYNLMSTTTLTGDFLEQIPGATFPSNIDLHELFVTKNGSLIVTANNVTTADLTSVGGPANGWVVAGLLYEIDIATNEVLFSWNSLDHLDQLPFNTSHYPLGSEGYTGGSQSLAWGYFHINAVDPYEGGYLISSRYFCSAIAINDKGHVKWRLDGRNGGDFKLVGKNTPFCYQHDIRAVNRRKSGVTLHMHDNHNCPIDNGTVPTSAKIIDVDFKAKTATLKQRYLNESGQIYSTAQGNFQPLANGNILAGHGWIPVVEEFSPLGEIVATTQFGAADPRPGGGYLSAVKPTLSYRAFKQAWVGCPETKPDVVAQSAKSGTKVFVSWNGATDVKSWEVYAGTSQRNLKLVKKAKKQGFETEVTVQATGYVQVHPVLKQGSKCKTVNSAVIRVT